MSAIAGIVALDGRPVARHEVAAMLDALAHRGPDGAGMRCAGAVGMGHRLLHTTPESLREVQPAADAASGVMVVADARIDNRRELLASLRDGGDPAPTDVELILRAYLRWGEGCVARLAGDFAFALWDGPRRTLLCARDAMGVKPLYLYRTGRLFAFASEAKGLFAHPEVPRRIDEEQVARFLEMRHDDRARTMFRDVGRLPAAHLLVVSEGRSRLTRYWSPDQAPDVRYSRGEEYAEAFRERLAEAVQARLRCAGSLGATLSGGLDSSSIVCTAKGVRGGAAEALHTFSLIFPGLPDEDLRLIDERRYIDEVVRGGGVRPHRVRGDRLTPLGEVDRILGHLDEPFFAPNLYLHWGLYGAARRAGVRVLLDGFDGDSCVSHGVERLAALLRRGAWPEFEAEVRAFAARRGIAPEAVLRHYGLPQLSGHARRGEWLAWWRTMRELRGRFGVRGTTVSHGLRPALPEPLRALWRAARGRPTPDESLLRPELARPAAAEPPADSPRAAHVAGLSDPLYQLTLELADKSAAAFGIEPRYPFFDRRLMEFCVGLPEEQKFADGWTRLVFRRAMEGILPPAVQWRGSKGNLTPNFQRALRGADRAAISRIDRRRLAPYVEPSTLGRVAERFFARPASGRADGDGQMLFQAAVLDRWLARSAEPMQARAAAVPATV